MTELLALRHEVFCVEQGVSVREEHDGRDGEGVHLVAVSDGSVLATCRLLFVGPTVQFSRLAVQRDARRRGIASRLLELADQETRAGGARRIVLHAQTYARSLYEGAGLPTARSGVHGVRDRAHRDGEAPVTQLSGPVGGAIASARWQRFGSTRSAASACSWPPGRRWRRCSRFLRWSSSDELGAPTLRPDPRPGRAAAGADRAAGPVLGRGRDRHARVAGGLRAGRVAR